ncbi:predicted protein [Naegleria gruberi]|uniref:Predicted protein n=1 Tax=Naegleria gruberi TaxID=5762 RepID=D2V810_NAEGR|nr:uncharacterized protein NAEGRDRAFT_47410 [Naegleria gruberi]EFC47098.1 predicted protein [Naegleria gruberi]|eukprot:XP_002679842.1 predicted protein [Naegleria gruberi strain NEG-M]
MSTQQQDQKENTSSSSSESSSSSSFTKPSDLPKVSATAASNLKELLKSEYSQFTREAIQKKYIQEGTDLPFKARVEAKIEGFYGGDVGAQALKTLRKGVHEGKFKKGMTPLQKRIGLLFGSFVLGQAFYFGGRYVFDLFTNNKELQNRDQGYYYGRNPTEFNSEVEKLTMRMIRDYQNFKGSNDISPDERTMIERDAFNRISVKYAEQQEILGSSTINPPASKYVPR